MDAVTRSLLKEFVSANSIAGDDEPTQFEHFCNYLITVDTVGTDFEVESIATGATEFGIDGVAIIANDALIEDEEQLVDVIESNRYLSCSFIFIQSKSATSFSVGEMLKFTAAVKDFFFNANALNRANDRLKQCNALQLRLYEAATKFARGLPTLHLYYAYTGVWKDDPVARTVIDKELDAFRDASMFSDIRFTPIDASGLQRLYFKSKNAIKAEVDFPTSVAMPEIANIKEAYIGVISAKEYLKLVVDENGELIKKVFFDNLRDYQGDTQVNLAIGQTIESSSASQFPIRNNGVTIVARNLSRVSNRFIIEDYQIVNGCQSSHVLASRRAKLTDDIFCPIKIVNTDHEETIREIIISSNRQNEISADSFWILDDIHKKLEIYFEQQAGDAKLFYERRSGQYDITGVERSRIISKDVLLKSYASMFLAETNRVGRYYKDLLPQIRKTIFAKGDNLAPYHTSALAHWRLEFLFRNRRLDRSWKAFRYPLLLAARCLVEREEGLKEQDKLRDAYCATINEYLTDAEAAAGLFAEANACLTQIVDEIGLDYSKRVAKMRDLRDAIVSYFTA